MEEITISITPEDIHTEDLKIEQGHCFLNSYNVASKYKSVNIIEGIIVAFTKERKIFKITPHVWNKRNEVHFDVTNEQVWQSSDKMIDSAEIKYVSKKLYDFNDLKNVNEFTFSDETYLEIEIIKKAYGEYEQNTNNKMAD